MAKQFANVDGRHGAPTGRPCYGIPDNCEPRTVRLFRVVLSGDYDDGGAYWGAGQPLYCATDGGDYRQFTRADTRRDAAIALDLTDTLLKVPA